MSRNRVIFRRFGHGRHAPRGHSFQVSGISPPAHDRTVGGVSDYLVEVYVSRSSVSCAEQGCADVSRAAEQLTREGRQVRLVRSILVPEDETCFYFFEAQTRDAVWETVSRAGLRFERVLRAVSGWEPPALPDSATVPDRPDTSTKRTHEGERQ